MTKRIAALLAALLLLAGCGAADGWRVKVREQDDIIVTKVVTSPVVNVQETAGKDDIGWFLLTEEELVKQLNERAAADGIPLLADKEPTSSLHKLSGASGWVSIATKEDTDKVKKVEFTFYARTDEEARISGKYIYYLLNMFTENRAKEISDTLYLFERPEGKIQPVRVLVCGNTVYKIIDAYNPGDSMKLTIEAAIDPAWKVKPEKTLPVRPED